MADLAISELTELRACATSQVTSAPKEKDIGLGNLNWADIDEKSIKSSEPIPFPTLSLLSKPL